MLVLEPEQQVVEAPAPVRVRGADPEVLKRVVEALESGRYEQCPKELRTPLRISHRDFRIEMGYCFWGVVCDLYDPGLLDRYQRADGILSTCWAPVEVVEWCCGVGTGGYFMRPDGSRFSPIYLNDCEGLPFPLIAWEIRSAYPEVFTPDVRWV